MQLMSNDCRAESFVDTNDTERTCDTQIIEKTPTHTKSKLLTRDAIYKTVKMSIMLKILPIEASAGEAAATKGLLELPVTSVRRTKPT